MQFWLKKCKNKENNASRKIKIQNRTGQNISLLPFPDDKHVDRIIHNVNKMQAIAYRNIYEYYNLYNGAIKT